MEEQVMLGVEALQQILMVRKLSVISILVGNSETSYFVAKRNYFLEIWQDITARKFPFYLLMGKSLSSSIK